MPLQWEMNLEIPEYRPKPVVGAEEPTPKPVVRHQRSSSDTLMKALPQLEERQSIFNKLKQQAEADAKKDMAKMRNDRAKSPLLETPLQLVTEDELVTSQQMEDLEWDEFEAAAAAAFASDFFYLKSGCEKILVSRCSQSRTSRWRMGHSIVGPVAASPKNVPKDCHRSEVSERRVPSFSHSVSLSSCVVGHQQVLIPIN